MDVFFVAIVLFAAMAFGTGDGQFDVHADSSNVPSESEVRSVTRKHSDQFGGVVKHFVTTQLSGLPHFNHC